MHSGRGDIRMPRKRNRQVHQGEPRVKVVFLKNAIEVLNDGFIEGRGHKPHAVKIKFHGTSLIE